MVIKPHVCDCLSDKALFDTAGPKGFGTFVLSQSYNLQAIKDDYKDSENRLEIAFHTGM